MSDILVVHGPNLNLLGTREPSLYGTQTLDNLNEMLHKKAKSLNLSLQCFQSNHEGELLQAIHQAIGTTQGLIINPGGLTHSSIAIRDAVKAYPHPTLEVHISNIFQRESFRHQSFISSVVTGTLCGLGPHGYLLALDHLSTLLQGKA